MGYMLTGLLGYLTFVITLGFVESLGNGVVPDATKYVNKFEKLYGKEVRITVKFADFEDPDIAGICYPFSKSIELDESYWNTLNDAGKEALIFHELGHCVLFRGHSDYKKGDHCPASLMHSELHPRCYEHYKDYYIKELFDK
jgi:hypothetical protein